MIKKLLLCLSLACLLLVSPAGTCSAAEYLITDQELTRLEQNLNQLELNSLEQEKRYQIVSELLVRSDKQITISNNQILLLEAQLTKAEESINLAQTSLQNANQSLDKYEKEVQSEIRKITWQRNIALIALTYMATKK